MTATTETHELLEQERLFWNAMQSKDAKAAGRMTDDGCIVVGAQGVSAIPDAKAMEKMTEEGKWQLKQFSFDEGTVQARFLTDDIAIVGYTVNESVIVDGKPLDMKAHDASVWVRRDGQWKCALHTESVAGDPFGRKDK